MCLSGEIAGLADGQWQMVRSAMKLYRQVAPIIKHGTTRRFGELGESWRHPCGWQAVVRLGVGEREALVVTHTFENSPAQIEVPLAGDWKITAQFEGVKAVVSRQKLQWPGAGDYNAAVLLLTR